MATLAARPIPNSCIPPHQTGTPRATQTSWIRFASSRPPTRLTLMLITRQAPRSRALRASSAEWMLSSRQTGVLRRGLEPGVIDDVVVGQRLLDQEQVEGVERLERRHVVERVGRVGVDLERRSMDIVPGRAGPRRHPSRARSSA